MSRERDHQGREEGAAAPAAVSRRALLGWAAALPLLGVAKAGRAQDTKVIRLGAGPTGATEFLFGGLVANAISNPPGSRDCDRGGNCGVPGLIAVAQTTGGAVENLKGVARGDIELGLSQADVASWLASGTAAFVGQDALSGLRVIAHLYPATVHLVVRADARINGVTDLRGRKVGLGADGSAQAATARMILSAYNVHGAQVQLKPLAFTAMPEALAGGAVDAIFLISAAPVLALEDLARRTPIRIVPIDGPVAAKLADVLPFYTIGGIPAGTYGAPADVPTIDVGILLVCRDNLDDDLAFGITRAIWHERNVALFQNGHPCGKLMSRDAAATGFSMPLHRGAARYYLGRGIEVPAEVVPPAAPPATPVHGAPSSRSS